MSAPAFVMQVGKVFIGFRYPILLLVMLWAIPMCSWAASVGYHASQRTTMSEQSGTGDADEYVATLNETRRVFVTEDRRSQRMKQLYWMLAALAVAASMLSLHKVRVGDRTGAFQMVLWGATCLCAAICFLVSIYFDWLQGTTASFGSGGVRLVAHRSSSPFIFWSILAGKFAGAALLVAFGFRCLAAGLANDSTT